MNSFIGRWRWFHSFFSKLNKNSFLLILKTSSNKENKGSKHKHETSYFSVSRPPNSIIHVRFIFNLNIYSCTVRHHHSCCMFMLLHIDFSRTVALVSNCLLQNKRFSLWRLVTSAYGCIIYLFTDLFSLQICSVLLIVWFKRHSCRTQSAPRYQNDFMQDRRYQITCFLFLIFWKKDKKRTLSLSLTHNQQDTLKIKLPKPVSYVSH